MPEITPDEVVELLNSRLFLYRLNDTQEIVLRESWQGKSYQQIAQTCKYDTDYIKGVGSRLWRSLSQRLGTAVTKSNLRSVISTYVYQYKLLSTESKTLSNPLNSQDHTYLDKSTIVEQLEWEKIKPNVQSYPLKLAIYLSSYYVKITEILTLKQWILEVHCQLMAILGMAGIGKTAFAVKRLQPIPLEINSSGLCQEAVDRAVTLKEPQIQPPSFDHQKLIERLKLEKKLFMAQIKQQGWKLGVKSAMTLSYKDFKRIEYLSQAFVGIDAIAFADLWQWLAVRQPDVRLQFEDDDLQELVPLHHENKAIFIEGWIEGVLTVWQQVKAQVDDVDLE